jgi:hypothetical protein
LAAPKVVSEHFTASVAADDDTSGETLLNVAGFVDRNDFIYGTKRQIRIGRWKRLAEASIREKKTAVVVGKAHTKMALDFCYLVFASGHLNDLWRRHLQKNYGAHQQDVSSWPFCEVFAGAINARLLRTCGPELLDASYSQFDPLQT